MNVTIKPFSIKKEIKAIPSKSVLHRQLICGMFTKGKVRIDNVIYSQDVLATLGILENLGVLVTRHPNGIALDASNMHEPAEVLFANESGSTLRFMIPVVASYGYQSTFTGAGRLPYRPMETYLEILPNKGVRLNYQNNFLPLTIAGTLQSGNYNVKGDISSQYITGLLMALANLQKRSVIEVITKLESKPYVDITLGVLESYGVTILQENNRFTIPGDCSFQEGNYYCEGDYSQAAFFLVAGAINGEVTMQGLSPKSKQGDREILTILKHMGANIKIDREITVSTSNLRGIDIDATNIPDLVPILCVAACKASGTTKVYGIERLKYKESDRITSTINMLHGIGADIHYDGTAIIVHGGKQLKGGTVDSVNDHRIAMSGAVASLLCENEVTILGADCVNKSYPEFFEDFLQ